jgi:hypothetical protein
MTYSCASEGSPYGRSVMTDRFCPLGFILFATFMSLLVWVFALVQSLPIH